MIIKDVKSNKNFGELQIIIYYTKDFAWIKKMTKYY